MTRRFPFAAVAALLAPLAVACGAEPNDDAEVGATRGASDERGASGERGAAGPGDVLASAAGDVGRPGGPGDRGGVQAPPSPAEPSLLPAGPLPFRGVNLSGAEFGTALPGRDGVDYTFPTAAGVDYYMSRGMNTFRLAFRWERLQPSARGELAAAYLAKLEALTSYATSRGAWVILEPHNFARYYGTPVGTAAVPNEVFADFWRRVAERQKGDAHVVFNLVNEPHDLPTEQWVGAANAAIAAIRAAGATNIIHAPGNAWTGAHSWTSSWYGTPNAVAMLAIEDPADNTVFEVHQYLDTTSGGKSAQCVSRTIGRERLQPFVAWLRAHGKRGFVGEFAGGDNDVCNAAVTDMLEAMVDASDVLEGWLWWGGGPWWGNYIFSLEPRSLAGALANPSPANDAPQMALLLPYLTR